MNSKANEPKAVIAKCRRCGAEAMLKPGLKLHKAEASCIKSLAQRLGRLEAAGGRTRISLYDAAQRRSR